MHKVIHYTRGHRRYRQNNTGPAAQRFEGCHAAIQGEQLGSQIELCSSTPDTASFMP